jgi:hypothetical protein
LSNLESGNASTVVSSGNSEFGARPVFDELSDTNSPHGGRNPPPNSSNVFNQNWRILAGDKRVIPNFLECGLGQAREVANQSASSAAAATTSTLAFGFSRA